MAEPRFRDSTSRWEFERKVACKKKDGGEHNWQPAGVEFAAGGIAAEGGRVYCVCLDDAFGEDS